MAVDSYRAASNGLRENRESSEITTASIEEMISTWQDEVRSRRRRSSTSSSNSSSSSSSK